MTRDEYECLKALRFGLPIRAPWGVWERLISEGWVDPPHPMPTALKVTEFKVTANGEWALGFYGAAE